MGEDGGGRAEAREGLGGGDASGAAHIPPPPPAPPPPQSAWRPSCRRRARGRVPTKSRPSASCRWGGEAHRPRASRGGRPGGTRMTPRSHAHGAGGGLSRTDPRRGGLTQPLPPWTLSASGCRRRIRPPWAAPPLPVALKPRFLAGGGGWGLRGVAWGCERDGGGGRWAELGSASAQKPPPHTHTLITGGWGGEVARNRGGRAGFALAGLWAEVAGEPSAPALGSGSRAPAPP